VFIGGKMNLMSDPDPPKTSPPPPTPEDIRVSRIWVIAFLAVSIPLSFGLLGLVIWTILKAM
jgi:hypothetical protein